MRPVAATVWLKLAWMRPVAGFTSWGSASTYVPLSFWTERYSMILRGSSWTRASSSSTSSAVEAARVLAVFLPLFIPSRSKRTSRSWGGELMLNSPLAST